MPLSLPIVPEWSCANGRVYGGCGPSRAAFPTFFEGDFVTYDGLKVVRDFRAALSKSSGYLKAPLNLDRYDSNRGILVQELVSFTVRFKQGVGTSGRAG